MTSLGFHTKLPIKPPGFSHYLSLSTSCLILENSSQNPKYRVRKASVSCRKGESVVVHKGIMESVWSHAMHLKSVETSHVKCFESRSFVCYFSSLSVSVISSQLFLLSAPTAEAQGLPCEFNGQVYQHGEDFQPDCQHQCTCMDRVVGCMPLCPNQVPLPNWRCSQPRLARPEGGCCEEWVCDDDNHISEEPDELTHTSLPDRRPLPNHISTLLEAPPHPQHPAATGGATFRGKQLLTL